MNIEFRPDYIKKKTAGDKAKRREWLVTKTKFYAIVLASFGLMLLAANIQSFIIH